VGPNNFQAGSSPIRLRTYNRDGRPELGDGRIPASFVQDEPQISVSGDAHDEDGPPKSLAAGVEAAPLLDSNTAQSRDSISASSISRRNTLTRKHSPSTTSMEQSVRDALNSLPEESLQKLGEKFESIRREMEELQAQIAKDEKEQKEQMDELGVEKREKRRQQKEKDDTTEKLKREVNSTDRAMRSAQQRKTQKEKLLREKQSERNRLHEDMAKWEKDIAQMHKRRGCFEAERDPLQDETGERVKELQAEIECLQDGLAQDELELKEKGKELKEAEEQRRSLPGGEESEESREQASQMQRDWEAKFHMLQSRINAVRRRERSQEGYLVFLRNQLDSAQATALQHPYPSNQANASGVDFDVGGQNQLKRRSRNSISMANAPIPSPSTAFAMADRSYPSGGFGNSRGNTIPPGFGQLPFVEINNDLADPLDEDGIRALTAGAPLSPTATSLLPAGMLDMVDDEPPSSSSRPIRYGTFGQSISPEDDPQSPASSSRSLSIISSPHGSSQHLPFSHYTGENSERRSIREDYGIDSSPSAPPAQTPSRFFPSWLHRGSKATGEPPALGSLKPSQSQSLPRQTDEAEPFHHKRRISFSAGWNMFHRNAVAPDIPEGGLPSAEGQGLAARRLGMFNSTSSNTNLFAERDPSSPRPVSIASSDMPRPSTDSGSIWAKHPHPSRLWSPEGADPWSRNPSRRPSVHGSPSMLKTSLAEPDDEILDESEIRQPPSNVGVIGTKPSSSKSITQRLNPAAPTFMIPLFRPKDKESRDGKDKDKSKHKAKDKGKEKEAAAERQPRISLTSTSEATDTPSMEDSPSDSRKSRELSVHTPSVSESRESLSLDQSFSNTPSDSAAASALKEQESGFRKLLRKGSSGKFVASLRTVTTKKGPTSVSNSDRTPVDGRTSFDEFAEDSGSGSAGHALGRSYDSVNSSPSLGSGPGGKAAKDKVSWTGRFSMSKKKPGRENPSLELDRDTVAESEENKS
jgi:hypothetical protein